MVLFTVCAVSKLNVQLPLVYSYTRLQKWSVKNNVHQISINLCVLQLKTRSKYIILCSVKTAWSTFIHSKNVLVNENAFIRYIFVGLIKKCIVENLNIILCT